MIDDHREIDFFLKELETIAQELTSMNGVEVHGKLKISVVEMDTLALIKGHKIYVSTNAQDYPRYLLKYILCHEIAHLAVKRHTRKFWEVVRNICPDYEKARDDLEKINLAGA